MLKITHVIAGLGKAGAETMLYNLLKYQTDSNIQYTVVSLGMTSYYEEKICKLGVPIYVYDIRKRPWQSVWKLRDVLNKSQIIVCWMYAACAICYAITGDKEHKKMLWNIRHASLNQDCNSKNTLIAASFCRRYSGSIRAILYNGELAQSVHKKFGFKELRSFVVENGCDVQIYRRDESARQRIDRFIEIKDKKMILSVGRYDPIKDYPTLIRAVGLVIKYRSDIALVLCGKELTKENPEIIKLVSQNGLIVNKNIFLLGTQNNVQEWMSAADIYVLHSVSEAFPNTLLEAMACECVCISTDVGPVRKLLEGEQIVGISNVQELAERIRHVLDLPEPERKKIGENNRKIIMNKYDIKKIVKNYEGIFE